MKTINITMTVWDNAMSAEEKQAVLLYCERAACKLYNENRNGPTAVKAERSKTWTDLSIKWDNGFMTAVDFLHEYNRKLCKLPLWNDGERLCMEWTIEKG